MPRPVSALSFGCIAGALGGVATALVAHGLGNIWIGVFGSTWSAVPSAIAGSFVSGMTLWRVSYRRIVRTGALAGAVVSLGVSLIAPFVVSAFFSLQLWILPDRGRADIPSLWILGMMALASVGGWAIPIATVVGAVCSLAGDLLGEKSQK